MGCALMTVGKARGVYGDSARNIDLGGTFDPCDLSVSSEVLSQQSHTSHGRRLTIAPRQRPVLGCGDFVNRHSSTNTT